MSARKSALRWVAALSMGLVASGGDLALAEGVRPLSHGREISRDIVGPEALGRHSGRSVDGAVISDSGPPAYAVLVPSDAVYDGITVRGQHLLIEDVTITGALDISTRLPVVLRRVRVFAERELPWLVLVRPGAGALHVLWSDIGGALVKRSASPYVGVALALRGDGALVYRSRIGAAADGVQIAARNITIRECEIANLLSRTNDHNDAVQMFGQAANVEIARNRIENRHPQTSAITVLGRDIAISANWLAGGGWTLYGGAGDNGKGGAGASGVRVEDNVFARTFFPRVGSFGPAVYWQTPAGSGNIWRANRDEQGRAVVPP
jgi:hypothetical protein